MSDQALSPTKVCVRWGCNRIALISEGLYYVCPACCSYYGSRPHPDLPSLAIGDETAGLALRLGDFRDGGGDPVEIAVAIDSLIRVAITDHEIRCHDARPSETSDREDLWVGLRDAIRALEEGVPRGGDLLQDLRDLLARTEATDTGEGG